MQNFRVKPEIPMRNWPEPTPGEMLRTVAVARIVCPKAASALPRITLFREWLLSEAADDMRRLRIDVMKSNKSGR